MASLGHVVFGLAVARTTKVRSVLSLLAFPALALLPDLDVIAFAFGIPYRDQFGHRGASHAIATGLVMGALIGWLLARVTGMMRPRSGALAGAIAMISHGLLDTLTDGGEGVALLWPLTSERFFAPWQPIPVAPIGLGFLSQRGLYCAAVELALFAPFLIYALWPRRGVRSRSPNESGA